MLTINDVNNCLYIAAQATLAPELCLKWDATISECGAGPDLTEADVELFEHAKHWVIELGQALLESDRLNKDLLKTVDEFREYILTLRAKIDSLEQPDPGR